MSAPTRQQVLGAVLILATILLLVLWRLVSLP